MLKGMDLGYLWGFWFYTFFSCDIWVYFRRM